MKKLQNEKKELLTNNAHDREMKIKVLEDKITDQVITNQRKQLQKELCLLKDKHNKKGKSAAIFHLKDKVVGKKKAVQEATVMKDPNTQEVLTKRKEIKEASLNYCVDLLTNRTAKAGFEEDVRLKDLVHEVRMAEDPEDDIKFSPEIFENSLKELKKKNKDKYEFVLKSGSDLKLALFKLFNLVWTFEEKPEQWRKTGIIQLYKGKGERNEFGNQRNIHTKVDIPKLFGHMVMSKAKDKIIQNMTKYQIGTKNGHRAQEHLFTLKSVIALNILYGLTILIQFYDISKFFDRESLRDGMNSIYNCGIKGKLYRLIFNRNKPKVKFQLHSRHIHIQ